MSESILVTGGAGFIGSHVTDQLIERGHTVVVLDDLSGGFTKNVSPEAEFVEGSIVDCELVESLFAQHRFDYVFHLAAYAAEGLSHFIRRFNYTNNVIGSINLINASVNYEVKCFVFTSSIAVYGNTPPPMTETQIPQPVDPYGIAKYTVELDLAAAREMFGLNSMIFRPHNVYGIRQNTGDRYRNVIGIFMNQALSGQPLSVFGDGEQTRAFTDISDVAPAIARSIEETAAYNQIFNIGADTPCSVKTLAEQVQSVMGAETGLVHRESRDEVVHAFADHNKAKSILGYEPTMGLEEGLKIMADWVRSTGPRQSQEFSQIEIEKNLPPSWKCSTG